MPPRIFIGGTGRSGTSILYKALGCHKDVYALPVEMRFLTDPDGLIELIDALTVHYSSVQAREAVFRFKRMMRIYLSSPWKAPYRAFNLPAWLGGEFYWRRLEEFCSELVEAEFRGTDLQVKPDDKERKEGCFVAWARSFDYRRRKLRPSSTLFTKLTLPRGRLKIVKYFPDRAHLVELAAGFVDDLFLNVTHAKGKKTWCEKTPANFLHVDFLWELFPKSVFYPY